MAGHAFAAAPAATAAIAPTSAGASDFPHVPELAIWAMMLLGFAVIGIAYRADIRKLMRAFV